MGGKEMRNCKELKHEKNGNVTEKVLLNTKISPTIKLPSRTIGV